MMAYRSPCQWAVAKGRKLSLLIRRKAPIRHMPKPNVASLLMRSPRNKGDNSATQTGQRHASKVALAMLVLRMARCQKNRSPAKKIPE